MPPQTGQPLTLYKDNRSIQVSPDAYDEAVGKGWSLSKPATKNFFQRVSQSIGQQSDPMGLFNMLKSVSAPGLMQQAWQHFHNSQQNPRMFGGAENTIGGMGSALYHQSAPGAATDLIKGRDMAPTVAGALLMHAGGGEETGGIEKAGEGMKDAFNLDKVKAGDTGEVLHELEKFRDTVKKKPTQAKMDVARVAHNALRDRINYEWEQVYKKAGSKPTDAAAVEQALGEMRKVDPETEHWIKTHIEPSKSGASVTAPLFAEVQKLISKYGSDMNNPKLDPVVRNEIGKARTSLKGLAEDAARRGGAQQQYAKARQMTRNFENIKYHTAYNTELIRPSTLWGLGGAIAGLKSMMGLGGSSEISGAFLGKAAGSEIGKRATPTNTWRIPEKSIEGERFMWKQLGEKPPEGTLKPKRAITDIPEWKPPKEAPKPKAEPPKGGGAKTAPKPKAAALKSSWSSMEEFNKDVAFHKALEEYMKRRGSV